MGDLIQANGSALTVKGATEVIPSFQPLNSRWSGVYPLTNEGASLSASSVFGVATLSVKGRVGKDVSFTDLEEGMRAEIIARMAAKDVSAVAYVYVHEEVNADGTTEQENAYPVALREGKEDDTVAKEIRSLAKEGKTGFAAIFKRDPANPENMLCPFLRSFRPVK